MNREEAQFILGAYRPNSGDAHDPQFQEALELARRDPALGQWFAGEQALDRAFSAKIRGQAVPVDLKTQLLLARTTARRAVWWRSPVWLAAAACSAVLLVAASLLLRKPASPAELVAFRTAMTAAASDMSVHADVWGLDADGYRKWLAENRGTSDFVLPPALAAKGIAACKIVGWQGHRVTMLCLKFDGRHVDVFVVNGTARRTTARTEATPQRPTVKPQGIKALQSKVSGAAKSYLTRGNTAVGQDWSEF